MERNRADIRTVTEQHLGAARNPGNEIFKLRLSIVIQLYRMMFKQLEPQVPEPGGLINTAGDKDSFLARVKRHRGNVPVVTLHAHQ